MKKLTSVILIATLLAGCTNEAGQLNKTNVGVVGGALAGGLLGSTIGKGEGKVLATVAGAALGGFAGGAIGRTMDQADLAAQQKAQTNALENMSDGSTLPWKGKNSSGSIKVTNTYQSQGRYCREFNQNINVGGQNQKGYGTACRQPDGSWQIVS
jgi:surface antigen